MNQKLMNPAAPNTLTAGKTLKLGVLALAASLAMTIAPRAWAAPAPEPLSRPQLGGDVAVQSVLRYIALHNNDVAGVQAVDPAVDSVARYIAAHSASAQRGLSASDLAVANYLHDHNVAVQTASAQRGPSAAELAVTSYLRAHGVTFNP